jgi:unsaturated chondroitin disaccharide hydrolase
MSAAWDQALATIRDNVAAFGPRFPATCSQHNNYGVREPHLGLPAGNNTDWTTGFRTGWLWLASEATGDGRLLRAAQVDVRSFVDRIDRAIDVDTHDLGFLYTPSCVAAWALDGDVDGGRAAIKAADALLARVVEPAGIVQAWGDLDDQAQRGRTIIDSLMNMPLLWWATVATGDPTYADKARRHVTQLATHIVRQDNTTFHTFWWDPATGEPLRGTTEQGFSDSSCWARGQAWGVYGFALNHAWATGRRPGATADESFLDAARRCADYYLAHLPDDLVPCWDLAFSDGSGEPRDSSAAAIAACGLFQLADLVGPGPEQDRYRSAATRTVESLAARYAPDPDRSNALLLHGVYDMPKRVGVDEANLWGDYFYAEALMRVSNPDWSPYWLAGRQEGTP